LYTTSAKVLLVIQNEAPMMDTCQPVQQDCLPLPLLSLL